MRRKDGELPIRLNHANALRLQIRLNAMNGFLIENKDVELIIDVFTKDCATPSIAALCTELHFD